MKLNTKLYIKKKKNEKTILPNNNKLYFMRLREHFF